MYKTKGFGKIVPFGRPTLTEDEWRQEDDNVGSLWRHNLSPLSKDVVKSGGTHTLVLS